MILYLATGNRHKQKEMQEILSDCEIKIPADDGINFNPQETGSTFYENSIIKAKALWQIVKKPVIADDSGLCVDALDGEPGIFTSRYAGQDFPHGRPDGKKISQDEQNKLLIQQLNEKLSKTGSKNRKCRYVCAMVLYVQPEQLYVAQDIFEGELIDNISKQAGSGGFGYDPIFFLPEYKKTAAELSSEEKNRISHRGKAVRKIARILQEIER